MGELVDEKACVLSPEAQAQLTVLNKWYAGPVMLAEVNTMRLGVPWQCCTN